MSFAPPINAIPRLAAVAAALLTVGVLFGQAPAAVAQEPERGEMGAVISTTQPSTLVISWRGRIAAPMANQIKSVFEQRRGEVTRVVFNIGSFGGWVAESERVIEVLRDIKKTHELQTVVSHGQTCGSMCVFIYAQGNRRVAALSSSWLFHEISRPNPDDKRLKVLDRPEWERLVDKYLRPAGVSGEWIDTMKPYTVKSDYWQTGADLVNTKSGLIHQALGNQQARVLETDGPPPGPTAAAPRSVIGDGRAPAGGVGARPSRAPNECKNYMPSIDAVVTVRCPG